MHKFGSHLIVLVILAGCGHETSDRISRVKKNGYLVVGTTHDNKMCGVFKYYDDKNNLVSTRSFENDTLHGLSVNYFADKRKKNEANYFHGLENGFSYTFDSLSGAVDYENYYYYGRIVGPNLYAAKGILRTYNFSNFEGDLIFHSSYDSVGNFFEMSNEYFQMSVVKQLKNGIAGSRLFLYNLQPPQLNFQYKLCTEDSRRVIIDSQKFVVTNPIFFDQVLPKLPVGQQYCIVLVFTDPANNVNHTIIREIILKN